MAGTFLADLVDDPQFRTIEAITHNVRNLNYATACEGLALRGMCAEAVPIDLVKQVIPRLPMPVLSMIAFLSAEGDQVGAIADLLEQDAFPGDLVGITIAVAFAIAAFSLQTGVEHYPRIRTALRVLASATLDQPPSANREQAIIALHAAANRCSDELMTAMLPDVPGRIHPPINISLVLQMLRCTPEQRVLMARHLLTPRSEPAEPGANAGPGPRSIIARATYEPVLGRNEPCWCKSGKKYKRCHGADGAPPPPRAKARSPRNLSVVDVQTMELADLGALPFHQLPDESLAAGIERLLKYRIWDVIERALAEFTARPRLSIEVRDRVRAVVIRQAIHSQQWELALRHAEQLRVAPRHPLRTTVTELVPVVQGAPDAVERLTKLFERIAANPDDGDGSALTLLLVAMPALCLILARAQIACDAFEADDGLFATMNQARVKLGLAPDDPAEQTFALYRGTDAEAEARKCEASARQAAEAVADELRGKLGDATRQNRDLARRIEDLERQLKDRSLPVAPSEPIADLTDVRALREKIDYLQATLREKNLELAELRRVPSLDPAAPGDRELEPRITDEPDAGEADELMDQASDELVADRRAKIPRWRPSAAADLGTLPAHVGREALRTVTELAVGDPATWRMVKKPKTIELVRMIRIGIHHRLLFRNDEASLEIMDIVSRESLNVALKRYS
ncbi:MAG TPA: SEC-C metal-binding domain-containing protein [Kofleriaceae bacterium]|nr:SEC-C metal-binding domain-containing protein [Kofleriaceae bacterium]